MKSKCILAFFLITLFFFLVNLVLSPFIASLFDLEVVDVSLGLSILCAVLFFYIAVKLMVVAEMKSNGGGFAFVLCLVVTLFGSLNVNYLRFGEASYRNGYIRGYGLCNRLGIPIIKGKGGDRYFLAVDAFGNKVLISAEYQKIESDDYSNLVEYTLKYHDSRGRVLDVRRWNQWYDKGDEYWSWKISEPLIMEKAEQDNVKIYASY
ncbi:MAG: hypothetical protein II222_04415 [Paraprevotella sp.]|nr:hypothetical protein [Paraprevotella sp.]